ncbi:MAG TPA: hypothetical protein GXZ32_00590 [Clostridiales bacterium]|nr:hypothetical protein [Clostridiales bacterium]
MNRVQRNRLRKRRRRAFWISLIFVCFLLVQGVIITNRAVTHINKDNSQKLVDVQRDKDVYTIMILGTKFKVDIRPVKVILEKLHIR